MKKTSKKIVVSMELNQKRCKEEIYDNLLGKKVDILHIILTANENTIQCRIMNNEERTNKKESIEGIADSLLFLSENFDDALWINTDNKSVSDIANEIIVHIRGFEDRNLSG